MYSVPLSFREVKEPVDSGRPYLKSFNKRKREERKSKKARKPKGKKKSSAKRRYAKRGAVKASRRTRFLVVRVSNINKILPKRNFKSKEGVLVKMSA